MVKKQELDSSSFQSSLKSEIKKAVNAISNSHSLYLDSSSIDISFKIDSKEKFVDIYLFADVSVDEFFTYFQDTLDDIVVKYDKGSYWDVVQPGEFMCRIYRDGLAPDEDADKDALTYGNVTKLANKACDYMNREHGFDMFVNDVHFDDEHIEIELKGVANDSGIVTQSHASVLVEPFDEIRSYSDLENLYLYDLEQELADNVDQVYEDD